MVLLHGPKYLSGVVWSLKCWQCIGEDCHLHPHEVNRAEKKTCREGESCLVKYLCILSLFCSSAETSMWFSVSERERKDLSSMC